MMNALRLLLSSIVAPVGFRRPPTRVSKPSHPTTRPNYKPNLDQYPSDNNTASRLELPQKYPAAFRVI